MRAGEDVDPGHTTMPSSFEALIGRLQRRNADRQHATDGGLHPHKAVPPLSETKLQSVQRALGFELPALVRALYSNVGNGGFGPEYGIVGTRGGFRLEGLTLETCYQRMLELENENPTWRWPKRLLPLANYGCGIWSCVDCAYQRLPMILWDPNNLDAALDGADARINWGNSFWYQGVTMNTWLRSWLDQEDLPEPTWPSDAWMKNRLGVA